MQLQYAVSIINLNVGEQVTREPKHAVFKTWFDVKGCCSVLPSTTILKRWARSDLTSFMHRKSFWLSFRPSFVRGGIICSPHLSPSGSFLGRFHRGYNLLFICANLSLSLNSSRGQLKVLWIDIVNLTEARQRICCLKNDLNEHSSHIFLLPAPPLGACRGS